MNCSSFSEALRRGWAKHSHSVMQLVEPRTFRGVQPLTAYLSRNCWAACCRGQCNGSFAWSPAFNTWPWPFPSVSSALKWAHLILKPQVWKCGQWSWPWHSVEWRMAGGAGSPQAPLTCTGVGAFCGTNWVSVFSSVKWGFGLDHH
jgi:hypothetical protein